MADDRIPIKVLIPPSLFKSQSNKSWNGMHCAPFVALSLNVDIVWWLMFNWPLVPQCFLWETKIAAKESNFRVEGSWGAWGTWARVRHEPLQCKSKSSISPAYEVIKKTEPQHPLLYKSHISLAGTKTQKKLSCERIMKQDWRVANW